MASVDEIQLFSLATPNGQKIGIALEELELPYKAHKINISKGEQFTKDFLKVNPNGKIPAILDPNGPDGKPINVFESGAILLYLAEKTGKLLPTDSHKRWETIQWLFWQMAGFGPMLGQLGHFYRYAPEKVEYGINRYSTEARRLFRVLETQLEGKSYIVGEEYTIADVATYPWAKNLPQYPKELVNADDYPNVMAWVNRIGERPAVQRGVLVTPF